MGRIFTESGEIRRMAELFGVSRMTVHNALRGATEGEMPDRIRREAIRAGGVERKRKVVISRVAM